jgi:hypothetical protein
MVEDPLSTRRVGRNSSKRFLDGRKAPSSIPGSVRIREAGSLKHGPCALKRNIVMEIVNISLFSHKKTKRRQEQTMQDSESVSLAN